MLWKEKTHPLGSAIRPCLRDTVREGENAAGTGFPEGNPAFLSPSARTAGSARHAKARHPRRGLPSPRRRHLRPPSRCGAVPCRAEPSRAGHRAFRPPPTVTTTAAVALRQRLANHRERGESASPQQPFSPPQQQRGPPASPLSTAALRPRPLRSLRPNGGGGSPRPARARLAPPSLLRRRRRPPPPARAASAPQVCPGGGGGGSCPPAAAARPHQPLWRRQVLGQSVSHLGCPTLAFPPPGSAKGHRALAAQVAAAAAFFRGCR